jgi:hypothetical protein
MLETSFYLYTALLLVELMLAIASRRDCLKTGPEACWQVDTFSGHLIGAQPPQNNMIQAFSVVGWHRVGYAKCKPPIGLPETIPVLPRLKN